jgi:hypothetical protein
MSRMSSFFSMYKALIFLFILITPLALPKCTTSVIQNATCDEVASFERNTVARFRFA